MQPKVGISVFIRNRKNQFLLGKRKNSHGDNTWANPGGHLEFGETPEICAKREALEETGLIITNVKLVGVTNDIFQLEDKHYITLHILSDITAGEPELREPHKCEEWKWFHPPNWPKPLFLSIENLFTHGLNWRDGAKLLEGVTPG